MNLPTCPPLASASHLKSALRAFRCLVRRTTGAALAGLLLVLSVPCLADTLTGEVVGIADGDTLTLLDATKTQHKIRLSGIDAPEKKQPFGERSKQNLAALVFRKQVTVEWKKLDRYGRVIGKVFRGKDDVCLAQVRAGMAWHYKTYEREQSRDDRESYAQAEDEARQNRRGLWRDPTPTPPWDFRHSRKTRH